MRKSTFYYQWHSRFCDFIFINYNYRLEISLLILQNFCVKITDLGETKRVDQPPKHNLPPIPARNWAPPEVLSPFATAYSYTMKSDIFGVTMIVYEVMWILQLYILSFKSIQCITISVTRQRNFLVCRFYQ